MIDMDLFVRFVVALSFVLALIAGVSWVGRRYMTGGYFGPPGGKRRRLGIVEVLPLDGRTRLVIVRRDDVEHVVLLGASGVAVVERSIAPAGGFTGALAGAAEFTKRAQ